MTDARPDPDEEAQRLAGEAIAAGEPNAWFERLYASARRGEVDVPWDRGAPHPALADWAGEQRLDGTGRRAVVVGCGLGEDAEFVASLGYTTTAFDLSPTAVAGARDRFPESTVSYEVADLFELPAGWGGAFDLVLESMTVQSMPRPLRAQAIDGVRSLVARGGTLLVIATALGDGDDPEAGPPWPMSRADVGAFAGAGLTVTEVAELPVNGRARWRASFARS